MAAKPIEAVRFSAQINAMKAEVRGNIDRIVQGAAFIVFEGVSVGNRYGPGTPVDTGFARNSWFASVGAVTGNPAAPAKPVKGQTLAPNTDVAQLTLLGAKAGDLLTITNSATYAEALETGHSKQAPAGMVRIVAAQWSTIVNDVAKSLARRA